MKKLLIFTVVLWSLVCVGMTCWSVAPAHSHNPLAAGARDGGAYVTDKAYALPQQGPQTPLAAIQQPQRQQMRPPARPWEADQTYQQELNLLIRESALRQRQYRQRAEADLSRLEAQRVENTNRHLASMERLGNRKNKSYTDYSTLASRHNAQQADYRARVSQINMTLELGQLREQGDLNRRIRALDDSYARREPWKTMLADR
ncbi:MAG: hypothetical protein ACK4PK_01880 [Alphaproteobacteria bacterium]